MEVAVIIPAYDAQETLDAALASVAAQSRKPGEVVVVDDGSSDGTGEVAASWRPRLRLTVLRHDTPLGPGAARRAGIAASAAPVIALLDADDAWRPDHLEVLADTLGRCGGIASADAVRWVPGGGMLRRTYRDLLPIPVPTRQPSAILRNNFVFVGSMFRRSDYLDAGGFRDGFSGAEDWDLWIRMLTHGVRVTGAPGPTVLYRVGAAGLTAGPDIHAVYARVLSAAAEDLVGHALHGDAVRAAEAAAARSTLAEAQAAARAGSCDEASRLAGSVRRGRLTTRLAARAVGAAPSLATRAVDAAVRRRWRS